MYAIRSYYDGQLWDAEVHLVTFDVGGKRFLQFSLVDITERNKVRSALRKSEADLKAIIENSLENIWSIDVNYNIQYVNKLFKDAFFQSFGVVLDKGVNILDSLPEGLRELWRERYDRALGGEQYSFLDRIELPSGDVYIQVALNPIFMDGRVVGASFYARDISESKRYEIQLFESKSMSYNFV